jgi:beta-phosphoglucomutase-like phosphatase (HAD superfamily)
MERDLIIFDCDGTLVDSEYLCNKVIADILAGFGLPQYTADYCVDHFAGMSAPVALDIISRETGRTFPPDIVKTYERGVNENMDQLRFIAGVPETLPRLAEKYHLCVGSNGERSTVLLSLKHADIHHHFLDERVFTKDMVVNAKPAPDLYLLAAHRMNIPPARVTVIEDTVTGVTAGKAAGMSVIGITAAYHNKESHTCALKAAGAGDVIDDFSLLAGLMGI